MINRQIITDREQAMAMIRQYTIDAPTIGSMDTETTGLHIIKDRPFIYVFGWVYHTDDIRVYAIDLEENPVLGRQVVRAWHTLASKLETYVGHHIVFDLQMEINYGEPYCVENVTDTQFYIRYGHDAKQQSKGGPPLGLKDYAVRYIDPHAADHEARLHTFKLDICTHYNNQLKSAMHCTKKFLEDFFKDKINTIDMLTPVQQAAYNQWFQALPRELSQNIYGFVEPDDVPYTLLPREPVLRYALEDVVLTLKVFLQLAPVVKARGNSYAIQIERDIIYPLVEMERVGFKIDLPYFHMSKIRLRNYIMQRRAYMYELAGMELKVGQHPTILKLLQENFGLECKSTNKDVLAHILYDLVQSGANPRAVNFIKVVQELRSMEKWYSTYILRFVKQLEYSDHIYTQIHQVGTISGRVTSDFQQFPKKGIRTVAGEELFYPRKMILVEGGEYDSTVYLDYSQIELRIQAIYTILCGNPEPNLIRAYAPYNCLNEAGERFDCQNADHIKAWDQPWFLEESPTERWKPTDIHGLTTSTAFDIDDTDEDFESLRSFGKRVNFAKNYGAQEKKIGTMFPELSPEQIKKIDGAYYKAFPGIKTYQDYCYRVALSCAYVANLFGVRFYNADGHILINLLIQSSGAFLLKIKIREIYLFSKRTGTRIRFQMNIHDELSWCKPASESPAVFFEIKKIMESWPDTLVPIVAEMDITHTTWAAKKKVKSINDFSMVRV